MSNLGAFLAILVISSMGPTSSGLSLRSPEPTSFVEDASEVFSGQDAPTPAAVAAADPHTAELKTEPEYYSTTQIWIDTIEKLVFGEHFEELVDFRVKCLNYLGDDWYRDRLNLHYANNWFQEYCYSDDPPMQKEKRYTFMRYVFDGLFLKNYKKCHEIWGSENVEKMVDYWYNFIDKLEFVTQKGAEERQEEQNLEASLAHPTDAPKPEDDHQRKSLAKHRVGMDMMKDDILGLLETLDRSIAALQDQGERFRQKQALLPPEQLFPLMMDQGHQNFLQIMQLFSDRQDFLCRFEEGFSATMSKDLARWGDMLNDFAKIVTDHASGAKL